MSSQHITQTAVTARRPSAALRKAVEAYRTEHKAWKRGRANCSSAWPAVTMLPRLLSRLKLKDGRERRVFDAVHPRCANWPREFRSAFRLTKNGETAKSRQGDQPLLRSFVTKI